MLTEPTVLVLLVAAVAIAASNWHWYLLSKRARADGNAKGPSMLPLVTQILVLLAWLMHEPDKLPWLHPMSFMLVGLVDISLWFILAFGVKSLFKVGKS